MIDPFDKLFPPKSEGAKMREAYLNRHKAPDGGQLDYYAFYTEWSEEDQEYFGRSVEFPSLSWGDTDRSVALLGIEEAVRQVLVDMQATGERPPLPYLRDKRPLDRDDDLICQCAQLPARTRNALLRWGITTIGELRARYNNSDPAELRDLRGIGPQGYRDICALLKVETP